MKSRTYTLIAGSALCASLLAFGACSSDSGTDTGNADQVESALEPISPFRCRRAIRECVEERCSAEIRDLLSTFPLSPPGIRAIRALQQCAQTKCGNVCNGTGGAAGAGGAMGAGGAATGGAAGAGGAAAGGAPEAGGAAGAGGAVTGGAAGAGGAATGGAPEAGGAAGAGGAATGGAPETGGAPATGGGGPGGVDLSGTWISHVTTAGTITAPVVGTTAANIDIVLRLVVTQTATTLDGTLQICRLNPVTTPNASSLVVTFTPAVLATLQTTVSEPAFTAMIGQPVPLPPVTILTGQNAAGMSVDSDMDGNPGVTIPSNVGGIIQLNAFTGLTINTSLTSTLTNATTITGTASFASTGVVFGSDNPILTSGNINVTPSSNAIPFTATKLAGNVPCSEVLMNF